MSGIKTTKNEKNYYLNYIKVDGDGNGDGDGDSFVAGEAEGEVTMNVSASEIEVESECESVSVDSVEDMYVSKLTLDEANSVLPPPSQQGSESESTDESYEESNDEDESNESNESDDEHYFRSSAPGASYLAMNHHGTVLTMNSHDDDRSIHSVPRTCLPPTAGANGLLDAEASRDEEDEEVLSFLLPPPDAMDYALTEHRHESQCHTPVITLQNVVSASSLAASRSSNINSNKENHLSSNARPRSGRHPRSKSPVRKSSKKVLSSSSNTQNTKTNKNQKQPLKTEGKAAVAAATGVVDVDTQRLPLPPNHYSHLLDAYEFVQDPSIPPLPPPPKEFVQSPTDEKHMNAINQSPNTSYEDDIELGGLSEQEIVDGHKISNNSRKQKKQQQQKKGKLSTIFSPPAASKILKDQDTPDTGDLSPEGNGNPSGNNITYDSYSGRQLFSPGPNGAPESSFDEGYEGGESDDADCSTYRNHRNGRNKNHRNNTSVCKNRCIWAIIIFVLALVLVGAVGTIAYAMFLQSQSMSIASTAAAAASGAVVNIATLSPTSAPQESESAIVIAITNETKSNFNATQPGDIGFEWVTTTAPFDSNNATTLRPISSLRPRAERPTSEPTPAPTGKPTTGVPTLAPIQTMFPTAEGDFVGRLQALLQSKNYNNGNMEDESSFVFAFDFSNAEAMTDPANLALVYLAREVAAVMGLPEAEDLYEAAASPPMEAATRIVTEPDRKDEIVQVEAEKELGTVVVVKAGEEPPVNARNPNFVPIRLQNYDDEKLLQRFALLTLQFGASPSSSVDAFGKDGGNAYAFGNEEEDDDVFFVSPMKRIVIPEDALAEATGSSSNIDSSVSSKAPIDPSTLADPNDVRFLVDECDWEGVDCNSDSASNDNIVTKLRWDYRNLDGSIAPTVGLLTALTSLDLSNNDLGGSIPESLYELTNLEEVYLFQNDLGGTLSKSFGALDKLRRFHVSHNALTGSLPTEMKSDEGSEGDIRPLQYFNIYDNQFTGSLPSDLRWRKCVHLDVGRNQLTGTLPNDIGNKFVGLRHLYLDHNAFSGTLPASYNAVGNGRLVMLAIESNRLTGTVPGEREIYDTLVQYTLHDNFFDSLERENCNNNLMVEFKADCPNICTCFGRFFNFCERWCGANVLNNPNNWNNGWQQQRPPPQQNWQQPQNWQQQQRPPSNNWSF